MMPLIPLLSCCALSLTARRSFPIVVLHMLHRCSLFRVLSYPVYPSTNRTYTHTTTTSRLRYTLSVLNIEYLIAILLMRSSNNLRRDELSAKKSLAREYPRSYSAGAGPSGGSRRRNTDS